MNWSTFVTRGKKAMRMPPLHAADAALVDDFTDAAWAERGLSRRTLVNARAAQQL